MFYNKGFSDLIGLDEQVPQAKHRFLALLRGINVGGNNIIKKEELKDCFESLGFHQVQTYIQSGNILFMSEQSSIKRLTECIEQGLSERFNYDAQALVISRSKYNRAIQQAPDSWGTDSDFKHNALFTLAGTTPAKWTKQLPPLKAEFESRSIGPGVVFWSVSKEFQTRSSLMKLPSLPAYQQVTVRNHNTVFKLQQLLAELGS